MWCHHSPGEKEAIIIPTFLGSICAKKKFVPHLKKIHASLKCNLKLKTKPFKNTSGFLFLMICVTFFIAEIARIQSGGKPPGRDSKFVDIYHEKPIRLTVRALVPVKEHPKVSWYLYFIYFTHCMHTMCEFSQFWSHFQGTMHCLPQRLKSTFFDFFSNGAAQKVPAE